MMISLLVISKDSQTRDAFIGQLCDNEHINQFDRTVFTSEGSSLGIEDVRTLQKTVFLQPLKSQQKAVIVANAHTATTEAQNALLKLLEEPPARTILVLSAATEKPFLPTIISRCKVIRLDTQAPHTISEEANSMLEQIIAGSISDKLAIAEIIAKDKEAAIDTIEALLHAARGKMLNEPGRLTYARTAEVLLRTHRQASTTNVNMRFLLEHAFLAL